MLKEFKVRAMIPTADLERAKLFYGEKLGLGDPSATFPNGVTYDCRDGSAIHVYITPENAGKSPATIASWEVTDLVNLVKSLRSKGVEFEEYDTPQIKTVGGIATMGPVKTAWFKDPDGNILVLVQPPGQD